MTRWFLGLLRWAVDRARRVRALRKIKPFVRSVLLDGAMPISHVLQNRSFASYTDSKGVTFQLIEGFRDAVKPGWQWILRPRKHEPISLEAMKAKVDYCSSMVSEMLSFLSAHGFHVEGKSVMEVGCFDGIKTFPILSAGAAHVTGSDINRYYVLDKPASEATEDDLKRVEEYLRTLRRTAAAAVLGSDNIPDAVSFVEDDITASGFPDESFDLVCSWEVLEHVMDPDRMFLEIHRLLRPGGFAFHDYNPFFSLNGGHSQCTLDFPWGHVALDDADFESYVKRFRPVEVDMAMNIYRHCLNRMSLKDLEMSARSSGLEVIAVLPWPDQQHANALSERVFEAATVNYPSVSVQDLISPCVWILLRKAGG